MRLRGTTPEREGPGLEGHDYAEEGVRVDSSSQFYLYWNFIHLLFPDQVKIFFGQNN